MLKESSRRQRLLVALVAFVVSATATIVAASLPSGSSAAPQGDGAASSSASSSGKVRDVRMGIAYGDTLTWKSDKALNRALDDAVGVGAKWVRVDLSWNNIQPESAVNYEWHRFDRVAKAAKAHRLNVVAVIAYTPKWARVAGCTGSQSCAPADPDTFAGFAKQAAERYAPMGVHTWEVWNEPNIGFWRPAPDPARFTELVKVTSRALRSADSKAYVVMGGLAGIKSDSKGNRLSPLDFLTAAAKRGVNKYVDAIGYHPYNFPALPSATPGTGTAFERISTVQGNLMAVLDTYGTPDLPIWLTETGAPTSGAGEVSDGTTVTDDTDHVTEARQAEIAVDTVKTAVANPHVDAMFWYTDQDLAPAEEKLRPTRYYGLRRYDGSKKPAFDALKKAITDYEGKRKRK
ncbi:cellulase family glycosylhydrolase [Streptomyces sp. NPDC046862]|uniref:cellulase family glycosylhydrolase n=1 Tax=Streptomyces sp. NPDC046862 TaxID=3154603 RepID=UPI0034529B14